MKKIYLLFLLFTAFFANAQEPFITTWVMTEWDLTINTPIYSEPNGELYDYTVDFGDGTVLTNQTGPVSHTYASAGTYTMTLSGDFNRLEVALNDKGNIRSVEQWGDVDWITMYRAFNECYTLIINATDAPDLSQVTDLTEMFKGASSINQSINHWDVSNVTNMNGLFYGASSFDQPLDEWDVSNVTTMRDLFHDAQAFNQPLNNWDVSGVTDMSDLFYGANAFNQPLNNWDVSNVSNMRAMFGSVDYFNQPLDNWDVSNCTIMESMFYGAISFNQSLNSWNVSNVVEMGDMFHWAESFNQPLDSWDVSAVTDMSNMFNKAIVFNQPLEAWDVSNVINMRYMFYEALQFNQPLGGWDVSSVTTMHSMFMWASAFNQNINNWNVENVTEMPHMFSNASAYNSELNNWNLASLFDASYMFENATSFNQSLNDWDISNVPHLGALLMGATSFNQPLNNWVFQEEAFIGSMFAGASSFNQDISGWQFNEISFNDFVRLSGLDSGNYDALLNRFVELGIEGIYFNVEGLEYCDSAAHNHLVNEMGWTLIEDSLSNDCEFNELAGSISLDEGGNGCTAEDSQMNNFLITVNNGDFIYSSSASEGSYTLNLLEGTYTIGLLNVPDYLTVTPAMSEITFEGFGNTETLNFCLTANETVNDLNITLLPLEEARPGFETDYQLVMQNMGTQMVAAATITLSFDDTLQTFLSADPAPASTTANSLTFDVANLQPFESRIINLTTELFTPPTVSGGEISEFTAIVTPNDDDYTPTDNTFVLEQEVVNSYDPNDKRVLQGERIYIEQADEYLNYIIRFQNTGTASAITVRIEDLLHENLDWATFTPLSASHDYRVEIIEGNQVEFIFEDINLPHEAANAEGSNGFIAYKIKPVADIQVGDVMEGNASIFFDYNLPIITNVATTEVIAPIVVTLTQTGATCHGESDGSASVNVSGGSEDYTYEWSSDEGTASTAEGLAAGEYTVTITDSYGESITLPVTITQPGAMAVSSQPVDDATTIGGNATFSVTASNVDQYQWQASPDGENWANIADGGTAPSYSGTGTAILNITGVPFAYNGYYYRAVLENGQDCETYSTSALLEVSDVAALEGLDKLTVTVYPNPARAEVFIAIPGSSGHHNLRLFVYDISGRQLVDRPVSTDLEKIDMTGFASGMYLFTISSDTVRFTKQIVKE